MTLAKRWRVIVAAIRQDWHEHKCKCGRTQWVEGTDTWTDQSECVPCESKAFEAWQARHEAREQLKRAVQHEKRGAA
jgi:hypothetical protein